MAQAIFISWSIALPEYSLQVPANRLSHVDHGGPFTAPQLKVIAEVCSLTTFAIFSTLVLKEKLRWVDLGAFALILAGVLVSLLTKPAVKAVPPVMPPALAPGPQVQQEVPQSEVQVFTVGGRKMLVGGDSIIFNGGNDGDLGNNEVRVQVVSGEESLKPPHEGILLENEAVAVLDSPELVERVDPAVHLEPPEGNVLLQLAAEEAKKNS